jgi:hypothetical protein
VFSALKIKQRPDFIDKTDSSFLFALPFLVLCLIRGENEGRGQFQDAASKLGQHPPGGRLDMKRARAVAYRFLITLTLS